MSDLRASRLPKAVKNNQARSPPTAAAIGAAFRNRRNELERESRDRP